MRICADFKGIEVSVNGRVCVRWREAVKLLASVSCHSVDGVALLCGQLDFACLRGDSALLFAICGICSIAITFKESFG